MSRRLSSLFSSSKDKEKESDDTPYVEPIQHGSASPLTASPTASPALKGKLHKHKLTLSSNFTLDSDPAPLGPPPTFQETAGGITPRSNSRPPSRNGSARADSPHSREGSRSRPQTPTLLLPPGYSSKQYSPISPGAGRLSKKKSSLSSKLDRKSPSESWDPKNGWIAGLKEQIPYDLHPLLHGERQPELWDEDGDVLVHLFSQSAARGPSFKLSSSLFAESHSLGYLNASTLDSSLQNLSFDDNTPFGAPLHSPLSSISETPDPSVPRIVPPLKETKTIYLPLELEEDYHNSESLPRDDDLELIVLYRNFFAFLKGGALIATPRQPSLYHIFMGISSILRRLQFGSADGSSWGELATNSFTRYCEELRLADVRSSREKTIEAIVLGENMRSWSLYSEGFVHAAGRLDGIKAIHSPKFSKVSPTTVSRLERAHLELDQRLLVLCSKLEDFDFPYMFAGLASSQTAEEAKLIRFKQWKLAFADMRKFTLAQYRRRYGAWPPNAKSKKNNFEESGLNRRLIKEVYQDFSNLYDMLVDHRELTTRTTESGRLTYDAANKDKGETIQHALRTIESEYDCATPPKLPPIPFDTPRLPGFSQSFWGGTAMSMNASSKKLKSNEINDILLGSYNREEMKPSTWIEEFTIYERKLSAGLTLDEVIDNRCGQWLFVYAVLQALPLVAVDAPEVNFGDGVEHFLCAAPRGGRPWVREDSTNITTWLNQTSASQLANTPGDAFEYSADGIYRRSHCWTIASRWLHESGAPDMDLPTLTATAPDPIPSSPQPPTVPTHESPAFVSPHLTPHHSPLLKPTSPTSGSRSVMSRSASSTSLHSALGGASTPQPRSRPSSTYNPNITFDSILGANTGGKGGKRKK